MKISWGVTLDKKKLKSLKERAAKINVGSSDEPTGIPCHWLKQHQFGDFVPNQDGPKKCGNYHGSVWHEVEGFGVSKWVVGGHIVVDYDKYRSQGYTDEEILRGCIEYLNCPPKRKKYARRTPKPLYGKLDDFPVRHRFGEKHGEKTIMMLLATNERKNKNFHGEGMSYVTKRKRRTKTS